MFVLMFGKNVLVGVAPIIKQTADSVYHLFV